MHPTHTVGQTHQIVNNILFHLQRGLVAIRLHGRNSTQVNTWKGHGKHTYELGAAASEQALGARRGRQEDMGLKVSLCFPPGWD